MYIRERATNPSFPQPSWGTLVGRTRLGGKGSREGTQGIKVGYYHHSGYYHSHYVTIGSDKDVYFRATIVLSKSS